MIAARYALISAGLHVCEVFSGSEIRTFPESLHVSSYVNTSIQTYGCVTLYSHWSRRVRAEEKVIASRLIPPSISPYRSSIRQREKGGWCEQSFVSHVEMLLIGFSLAADEDGGDRQLERVKEKLD